MTRPKGTILVIDDDESMTRLMSALLTDAGYEVTATTDSVWALEHVAEVAPDCVICDLMMPEVDGYTLCKHVKAEPNLANTKFIVHSAKTYEYDINRAYSFGADGFLTKPIDSAVFARKVGRIIDECIEISFWGVRGTLPVSGPDTLKYGGNTNCVSIRFPRGQFFVLDAGTGIKALGDQIAREGRRVRGTVLITHPHWDHINAIPFFTPLYMQGNEFEVIGAHQGDIGMQEILSAQMDGVYFPITVKEFAARVFFRDVGEETFDADGITVKSKLLSHPGRCLGYRMEYGGRSICYITDNELYPEDTPGYNPHFEQKLAEFCAGTDALITDTTYTDEEYKAKVDWGHSCISKVVELAHRSNAKKLYIIHHDPAQNDDAIDNKLQIAQDMLEELGSDVICIAPKERESFIISKA